MNPCQNNGTCVPNPNIPDGFICHCLPPYVGKFCEETKNITECDKMCKADPGDPEFMQYPFTIVIDNTYSQESNADLIKNVAMNLNIQKAKSYQLVTFNDYDYEIQCQPNVTEFNTTILYPQTTDYDVFKSEIDSIKFYCGTDQATERMFRGLLQACQESMETPLIIVTTDAGTKNVELEDDIKSCLDEKKATLKIVFNPGLNDYAKKNAEAMKSIEAYVRLADEVINMDGSLNFKELTKKLQDSITEHVLENCQCVPKPKPPPQPIEKGQCKADGECCDIIRCRVHQDKNFCCCNEDASFPRAACRLVPELGYYYCNPGKGHARKRLSPRCAQNNPLVPPRDYPGIPGIWGA